MKLVQRGSLHGRLCTCCGQTSLLKQSQRGLLHLVSCALANAGVRMAAMATRAFVMLSFVFMVLIWFCCFVFWLLSAPSGAVPRRVPQLSSIAASGSLLTSRLEKSYAGQREILANTP